MSKLFQALTVIALCAGACFAQDLVSEPSNSNHVDDSIMVNKQEPTNVSYEDLQAQEPSEPVAEEGSPVVNASQVVSESQETGPVKKANKRMTLATATKKGDPIKLRARGESLHSKGVTIQVLGGIMVPVGIVLTVINFEGYSDYASGDTQGNEGAYLGALFGETIATVGVAGIIIGGVMRKSGTRKIRLADELEGVSFLERHHVNVLPVASVDRRMGGLVVAGNF